MTKHKGDAELEELRGRRAMLDAVADEAQRKVRVRTKAGF